MYQEEKKKTLSGASADRGWKAVKAGRGNLSAGVRYRGSEGKKEHRRGVFTCGSETLNVIVG